MLRADTVVTFALDDTILAIEVRQVQEILSDVPVTRLPQAPAYLLGLIDVRGRSVPLVDLRFLLGDVPRAEDPNTRIILLWVEHADRRYLVALRVDRVIEVTGLDDDGSLTPMEESVLFDWDERLVRGVGRRNGRFVVLLHLASMFDPDLMASIRAKAREQAA